MSLRTLTRTAAKVVRLISGKADPRTVRILCYHRVRKERDYLSVTPEDFEAQMKHVASLGLRTISLKEVLDGKGDSRSLVLTFDDGFLDNYDQAYPIMKRHGFTAAIFCISSKMGTPGYLNREQILQMMKDGFEFGAHTVTHPHLPRISREEKQAEILNSRTALEAYTGKPFDLFCYPYGEFDSDCLEILKSSGFRAACSNTPGANRAGALGNPFLLKRTEISGFDSLEDYDLKLAGAYDTLHSILHAVRGRP